MKREIFRGDELTPSYMELPRDIRLAIVKRAGVDVQRALGITPNRGIGRAFGVVCSAKGNQDPRQFSPLVSPTRVLDRSTLMRKFAS